MNAVTGVGAPWKTSGTHWWNGTAAILKENPPMMKIAASTSAGDTEPLLAMALPTSSRLVRPVRP